MKKTLLWIYLSIAGCKEILREESVTQMVPSAETHQAKANTSILGSWQYSFPFYGSELTLNEDNTFHYHSQGCLSNTFSAGTWRLVGQGLILTSYDRYRDLLLPEEVIKNDSAPEVPAEEQDDELAVNTKNGKQLKSKSYHLDITQFLSNADIHTLDHDTTEYFDRQVLIFKNDSLYFFDSQKIRYGRARN